jgi:hypothetical protein
LVSVTFLKTLKKNSRQYYRRDQSPLESQNKDENIIIAC